MVIHFLLKSGVIKPVTIDIIKQVVENMERWYQHSTNINNGVTENNINTNTNINSVKRNRNRNTRRNNENQDASVMMVDRQTNNNISTNKVEYVIVMVNQKIIGIADSAKSVRSLVQGWRRSFAISQEIGCSSAIRKGSHVVDIRTEAGRNIRPLLVLENLHKLESIDLNSVTWQHLLNENIVEMCDVQETTELLIAAELKDAIEDVEKWTKKNPGRPYPFDKDQGTYTHAELHGCAIYCISGQLIPFSNFNAAVRNTFQVGQGKQAQGLHSTNAHQRFDTTMSEMW